VYYVLQESQVTVECVIPQKHHRTVMGAKGFKVQEITKEHEVGIKFPDRPPPPSPQTADAAAATAAAPQLNGDMQNGSAEGEVSTPPPATDDSPATPNKSDIILITGKKENCEEAAKALQVIASLFKLTPCKRNFPPRSV
jgi:hypothetical protein